MPEAKTVRRVLIALLAIIATAFVAARSVDGEPGEIVVREVVEPVPTVMWLGDSIKAVRTDLDPDGWIQGTIKGER